MAKVTISLAARRDLEAIDEYGLERFGEAAADRMQNGIREAFAVLVNYPSSAPLRPEYGLEIRCKTHRGYRILYRVANNGVLILRVIHHSRSMQDFGEA